MYSLAQVGHADFVRMCMDELSDSGKRAFLDRQIAQFSQLSNLVIFSIVNATFPVVRCGLYSFCCVC